MIKQVYTKKNVLKAAKERISLIFDEFENIVVSISGGKDSTTLANLAFQEARKRDRKIGLFFLDEEVVYQSTVEQIRHLMTKYPKYTIKLWLQIEFNLTNALSYEEAYLRCWESGKHEIWMRSKEQDGIKHKPWPKEDEIIKNRKIGLDFYAVIENFQRWRPDNTAFLIGLRATESMNRWRAVSKNPGHKDIFWTTKIKGGDKKVTAYPIYDWNFHDVWKYIYDENLKYSRIYDYMHKKGLGISEIRVSSLIHEKSFKALTELPEFEPKTYDKLLKRVKGVSFGNQYGKDSKMMKCRKLPKNYDNWMEYRDFLLKTYPDNSKKEIFVKRFNKQLNNNYVARQQCRQLILNDYENNLPIKNKPDPRKEKIKKWREIL